MKTQQKNFAFLVVVFFSFFCILSESSCAEEGPNSHPFKKIKVHFNQMNQNEKMLSPLSENLYSILTPFMQDNYANTAQEILDRLENSNQRSGLGNVNLTGIHWNKKFKNFHVGVNRQITPDLFHATRYMVEDTFFISIDAHSYLSELNTQGIIEILPADLKAFAGLEFIREYRIVHYAPNLMVAVTGDLEKLFLSFYLFHNLTFKNLKSYEYYSQKDYFRLRLGASVGLESSLIPVNSLGIGGGFFVDFESFANLSLYKKGAMDSRENPLGLLVNYEQEKTKTVLASLDLELDFFHLLKMTLLSYELNYELSQNHKIYLQIPSEDINLDSKDLKEDINSLFHFSMPDDLTNLSPYITSREMQKSELFLSRYSALLYEQEQTSQTQEILIQSAGVEKQFFKHRFENIRSIKNTILEVYNRALQRLLGRGIMEEIKTQRIRSISLEHESVDNGVNEKVFTVNQVALEIKHSFNAGRIHGKLFSPYKNYAHYFLTHFTNIDDKILKSLDQGLFKGGVQIESKIFIRENEFNYFHGQSPKQINESLKIICSFKINAKDEIDCKNDISKAYFAYIQGYEKNSEIMIWKLKDFVERLSFYVDHIQKYELIFGPSVAGYGYFQGHLDSGDEIKTFFKSGEIKSLGLLDQYR